MADLLSFPGSQTTVNSCIRGDAWPGPARHGKAVPGLVRLGGAWKASARQGKARMGAG